MPLNVIHGAAKVSSQSDQQRTNCAVGLHSTPQRLTRFGPRPSKFAALQTDLKTAIPHVAKPCCNRIVALVPSLGAGNATTQFHSGNYCFYGLAARGRRAANRRHATHRPANWMVQEQSGISRSCCRIYGGTGATGLGRRTQRSDRGTLDGSRWRARECFRNGTRCVATRRSTLIYDASDGSPTSRNDHHPHRFHRRRRPGACRFRRQSAAPGWQHHGVQTYRARLCRQVAKSTQGDRAEHQTRRDHV